MKKPLAYAAKRSMCVKKFRVYMKIIRLYTAKVRLYVKNFSLYIKKHLTSMKIFRLYIILFPPRSPKKNIIE
jgi:hypothetical protein